MYILCVYISRALKLAPSVNCFFFAYLFSLSPYAFSLHVFPENKNFSFRFVQIVALSYFLRCCDLFFRFRVIFSFTSFIYTLFDCVKISSVLPISNVISNGYVVSIWPLCCEMIVFMQLFHGQSLLSVPVHRMILCLFCIWFLFLCVSANGWFDESFIFFLFLLVYECPFTCRMPVPVARIRTSKSATGTTVSVFFYYYLLMLFYCT